MTQTEKFIALLAGLKEGDLSLLRRSAGRPLDAGLKAFDLFTGLWWPLRAESPGTPQRWCAWLTAKLYGSFPFPQAQRPLAALIGSSEPKHGLRGTADRDRFRARFDALLGAKALDLQLEPHLRWCLRQIAARRPVRREVNWAELLDDIWRWDRMLNPLNPADRGRMNAHASRCRCGIDHVTVQEVWACEYLNPVRAAGPDPSQGAENAKAD